MLKVIAGICEHWAQVQTRSTDTSSPDGTQVSISNILRAVNVLLLAFGARDVAGMNRRCVQQHGSKSVVPFLPATLGLVVLVCLTAAGRWKATWFDVLLLLATVYWVNALRGVFPVGMPPQFLPRLFGGTMVGVPLSYRRYGRCIYLDYNATTPIFPEVTQEMLPFTRECFANPAGKHVYGRACKLAVDEARGRVAALLDCHPDEIVFVSSGSEANNHAIVAAVTLFRCLRRATGGDSAVAKAHVVSSVVEHPAVKRCLDYLAGEGELDVTYVGVDEEGRVSVEDVKAALRPTTALVTIMHSNNEVGSLQPVEEIAAMCKAWGVLCHSDAAQSVGKVAVRVPELGVDMLSIVGQKFGAPMGIGALFVRRGLEVPPMIHGSGQESGRRAGSENVMLIAGMGKAAEVARLELKQLSEHMATLRERLLGRIMSGLGHEVTVHGPKDPAHRLPNTLSIGVAGLDARALLEKVSETVAASAGAARQSRRGEMSVVLRAMGVDKAVGLGTLRLSVGRHSTATEIDRAANDLLCAMKALLRREEHD